MSRIILTSDILDELNISIPKYSDKNNYNSYYFSPNMGIKLYSAKVSWMDANSISFVFEKVSHLNLLILLRNINERLIKVYKHCKEMRGLRELPQVPCLFYENDDRFYIKCNLPKLNGKYHIKCTSELQQLPFKKPSLETVYNCAILDIRNIWESQLSTHVGFKLELKEINYD